MRRWPRHTSREAGSSVRVRILDPDGNLRKRFASSMMDFYPIAGQGFQLFKVKAKAAAAS